MLSIQHMLKVNGLVCVEKWLVKLLQLHYYFGCYLGTGRFWYIRCYSLRKAFKDGYAMRL